MTTLPEAVADTTQTIQVEGIEVRIRGAGPRTVVMIHGWPDTADVWQPQIATLSPHVRCVSFTLPGFDRSHPRRAYEQDEIIHILHQVILATSPDHPVTLLLHDWGCVFGYRLAKTYPECVDAIIGVDVGDAGSREHLSTLGWRAKLFIAIYQLTLLLAWHLPVAWGDVITRKLAAAFRAPGLPASIGSHMNYPYHQQWTGRLRRTAFTPSCPMLFFYGSRKPFMFHSSDWLRAVEKTPYGRVVALPAGHWVFCGKTATEFGQTVLQWLNTLP